MAKKTRREKHIHVREIPEPEQSFKSFSLKELPWPMAALGIILLITIGTYLPVFNSGFVWDDVDYVRNNYLIRDMDLGAIFSKNVVGNYHPLTILILGIEYQLFGLNETGYHVVNLLLHLGNTVLAYYAVLLLTNKTHVALIAALLFGIHPLHTESVAWISELKDLLYTGFFLAAYIFYLKYLKDHQYRYYVTALALFLFSLLSKAMAASLPVLLLLTDYFTNRKLNAKAWMEKIPFFVLAIVFGIVAVFAQQSSAAIMEISNYSFVQRIVFACYGFMTYLWKFILPFNQSAFYPYPIKSGESLGAHFYLYPLLVLALIAAVIYSLRFTKKIFYGMGFYAITVFLVLQLLPVGGAIMAERYTYIPSIGIFYLMGEGLFLLWKKQHKVAIALLAIVTAYFSLLAFKRNGIWKNNVSLWTDVINKFPDSPIGYNNRGGTYVEENKPQLALVDLDKAIQLRPQYAEALNNRSIILANNKNNDAALADLNIAIKTQPTYAEAYNNRSIVLMELRRYSEALQDVNKALELRPGYPEAYYNRGLIYENTGKNDLALKDYDRALALRPGYPEATNNRNLILNERTSREPILTDYDNAIASNPGDPQLYYNRGLALFKLNRNTEAIKDLTRAIELTPNNVRAYLARADVFFAQKNNSEAMRDYNHVVIDTPDMAEPYVGRANILRDENRNQEAHRDYDKAIQLNPSLPNAYYNKGILLIKEKKFEEVIGQFTKVLELKGDSAVAYYNRGMAAFFLNRKETACKDLQTASGFGLQAAIDAHKQICQ